MINIRVLSSASSLNIGICFELSLDLLEARDIGRSASVCKLWNEAIKNRFENQKFWIGLSEREGVPFVEGQDRDRKKDFQVLYPMTISGRRIRRLFGEVVGPIPCISEVFLSKLNAPDPFEKGKLIKDTFVFVVDPHLIKRIAGVSTPLDLNAQGNLIELPADQVQNGKELVIPFSSKNFRVLCSHPLNGKENMPVFAKFSDDRVFSKCGASSNKVRVYFMREFVVNETKNKFYDVQESCLNGKGFGITPFRIRALFNAVKILETGKCPDSREPWFTYARCSDIIPFGNNVHHPIIGRFAPRAGVFVSSHDFDVGDDVSRCVGVVPGCPVEVLRPLALDHLGLGEGH